MNTSTLRHKAPQWTKTLDQGEIGNPRYRGAKGGRASGKSHYFATKVILRCLAEPNTKVICIREIQRSLEFSSKQLIEDKIKELGIEHYFEVQRTRILSRFGNGVIIFQGMQDHTAESVKSLEGFDIAWIDEAQSMSSRSIELLDPTLRKNTAEIWCSWNPQREADAVEVLFKNNPKAVCVHVNFNQNPFVTNSVKEMAEFSRSQNVLKYNHIWLGDFIKEVEGSLWNLDNIMEKIVTSDEVPELSRIVVAIDPAVTGNKNSDETGIIVAGRSRFSDAYYVLEDASLRSSPDAWVNRAIKKYYEYEADRIIAEVNNGGDLVENLLRNVDRNVAYSSVRATRGKIVRAEPIAALYERGQVFHVGRMTDLEEQMIFFDGRSNTSPDRLDALVWALTELTRSNGQAYWRVS
tara:strand:- start:2696 stop:3919 length:1224 start_codon:yes stop_codon:yes gene_type:complete